MNRLKKWHRLGIVLSFIWVICSVVISRSHEMDSRAIYSNMSIQSCQEEKRKFDDCWQEAQIKFPNEPYWVGHISTALFPVIVTWLAIFLSLGIYRWIMRGE